MSDILSDAREWLRENPVGERMGRAHDSECHRRHLECLVSRMAAEIERLREERRWISVEERVPERGVRVLVTLTPDSKGRREVCEAALIYEHFFETDYGSYEASHWMPLPAPPEGAS